MTMTVAMLLSGMSITAFAKEDEQNEDNYTYERSSDEGAGNEEDLPENGGEDEGQTVFNVSVRENIEGGSLTVQNDNDEEITEAEAGDTVYLVPTAEDGYTLTSIGYWKVGEDDKTGKLVVVKPDDDGNYSFEMPESNICVGAAFQDADDPLYMIDNKIGGDKKTDYTLYMAIEHAYVKENDKTVTAKLNIDERFFDIEDNSAKVILELRQYSSGGYTVVGSQTYDSIDDFKDLFDGVEAENGTYTLGNIGFNVADDAESLTAGSYVYCVVKIGTDSWVDAKGDPTYRWTYTGDATVIEDDADIPEAIVWMYNLDENTHRGSIIRGILKELGIKAGTVDNSNLGQNIGYLVGWEGYDSVEDPSVDEDYNVEYLLMGNLTEVQLDDFLAAMKEENVYVRLKSVPTAWTAGKTFNELFEIMSSEGSAIDAVVKLDSLIYDCDKDVIAKEEEYKDSEYWEDFKKEYDNANEIITQELEAEEYNEAYDALLEQYLNITGKISLSGDLELMAEKQADGTYTVSANLIGGEEAIYTYEWQDNSTGSEITSIDEDQLYKINLKITGTDPYYGEISASFAAPVDTDYEISTDATSVTINFEEIESVLNTPEPIIYVAKVYLDGELVSSQESVKNDITISGLDTKTTYTVETYTYNVIGYSTIHTDEIVTAKASSGSPSYSLSEKTGGSGSRKEETQETAAAPVLGGMTGETASAVFTDVSIDNEYYYAIMSAYEKGYMSGVSDNLFSPEGTLTRGMAARILWNMAGQPVPSSVAPFLDVTSDAWYAEPVAWAYENGIILGYDSTAFGPNDYVTTEQFEIMMTKYNGGNPAPYTGVSPLATRGYIAGRIAE